MNTNPIEIFRDAEHMALLTIVAESIGISPCEVSDQDIETFLAVLET